MSKYSNDKNEWLKDYTEFSQIDASNVRVSEDLFKIVRSRLFPNPWVIFAKTAVLHGIVGFSSLAICNQFGLNPFQTNQSLTTWFMKTGGHNVCMLLCGLFFMATTYLLSNFFLSLEELESVRRYEWLQIGIFGLVSLAAFHFFGADIVAVFAILWGLGAMIGGYLSIEGSYQLRKILE